VNGKRTLRQSLKTRDLARARKKAVALESPDVRIYKPVSEAVGAFLAHCESENLQDSTIRKYRNSLKHLNQFCEERGIDTVADTDLTLDQAEAFRAWRGLGPIASEKERQLFRQFCGFCVDHKWASENVGKRIKPLRNLKPNDIEPFTPAEVGKMIEACDRFGRGDYERSRARAIMLTLRYTALRIGDVAMLARDRISKDGNRWRIFLRTEKTGKAVFLPVRDELRLALNAVPAPRGAGPDCRYFFWNGITSERAVKGIAERTLAAVFRLSGVKRAHAHRFRHTLATELLGAGASFEEVADILGNSPEVVRKHYAKWSTARQARIDNLMDRVWAQFGHAGKNRLQVIASKG
jgi:integrase